MISCQFVRPDRLMYQGDVESLVLVAESGEIGIWPGHAPMIVALGNGVVRLHLPAADGGEQVDIIVSGGYAEVSNDTVTVLANHARKSDDIEADVVQATRDEAAQKRDAIPAEDPRRAFYEEKITWCDLLLSHA